MLRFPNAAVPHGHVEGKGGGDAGGSCGLSVLFSKQNKQGTAKMLSPGAFLMPIRQRCLV